MSMRSLLTLGAVLLISGSALGQEKLPPPTSLPPASQPIARSGPLGQEEAIASLFANGPGTMRRDDRQFWGTGDYLFAWFGGVNLPPLVTTAPPGTARATAGALGADGTTVLFDGAAGTSIRSGLRFTGGYWFDQQQSLGLAAGFTIIEGQARGYTNTVSDGILARPFIDAPTSTKQAILIAFPGLSNGTVNVRAQTGNFYETHIDLTEKALDFNWWRLYSIAGYRFFCYDEGLHINQTITTVAGNPDFVTGTQIITNDRFNTRNVFHGIDLGLRSEVYWRDLSLEMLTKIAVGKLYRSVDIRGDQTVTVPGVGTVQQTGGVYALGSNSDIHRDSDWVLLPEIGANVYWQMTSSLAFRVGYTGIWLNGIAHASDQIDFTINKNQLPGSVTSGGSARPIFPNAVANMWIHSVNIGLEYRY